LDVKKRFTAFAGMTARFESFCGVTGRRALKNVGKPLALW
jgi:hypothetical protein